MVKIPEDTLVPEIHDIGKLQNKWKHNFEDSGVELSTATWCGIMEHHCQIPREGYERLQEYPKHEDTFLLCIADNLASAVSRHHEAEGHAIYNVFKLWNPSSKKVTKPPLSKDENRIKELISFIGGNPNVNDYFRVYGERLHERAEDAKPGANITSLYTHSKLTGQFYRILNLLVSIKLKIINSLTKI